MAPDDGRARPAPRRRFVLGRTTRLDLFLALAGLAVSALEWWVALTAGGDVHDVVLAAASTGLSGCLLLRNARPVAVGVVTTGLLAALAMNQALADRVLSTSVLLLATPLVLISVTRGARSGAVGAVALAVGVVGSAVSPVVQVSEAPLWTYTAHVALLVAVWLWAWRRRQDAAARRREVAANVALARAQERNRLSAELHDVLGHSLTVIHAQANAELARRPGPGEQAAALESIRDIAKASLRDVRLLVGALRDAVDTLPVRLVALDDIVRTARAAGLVVTAHLPDRATLQQWDDELSPALALTLARCLQEGLTNMLRHGRPGGAASVALSRDVEGIRMTMSNTTGSQADRGAGVGLVGLRERARAHGGEVRAVHDGDRFVLDVRLPVA
ncbi:sensor histidine kinase [Cellulomonas xiejunii]|uniref:histidine kinase n=1 Tax=Cellulomonas xiejunii TaxID=2968083 RepID=A0ABY5KRC8_9CELL|nr:histidine kinase [Cellulomonas xiejunii]MCC2322241.1 histidine kinase [Cellulomonas xiejunii]UUI72294.1 histidine kinase [Cellulomonas xiejunii]